MWSDNDYDHLILDKKSEKFKTVMKIVKSSLLADYNFIKNELEKTNQIIKIVDSNMIFYYLDLGNYESDIKIINKLFSQSVCLAKYTELYEKGEVIIIWIPVNTRRDYTHLTINKENLESSIEKFEAFTASGVTYGENPRITIISRYEEIGKLLIHELIHNFDLDGSGYHECNESLIKTYKEIKNPPTQSQIQNYDYSFSIYESYTELLSSYLSIIFRNINLTNKKDLLERFETEILIELLYSYNTISNLIKINNYDTYEEFEVEQKFRGDICVYEYYYLKGLMYNNYKLTICNNKEMFQDNYLKIINIKKNDPLLKDIFNNVKTQTNFGYTFYN
jgi:hypothetical protein